jgi:hypothetical protein
MPCTRGQIAGYYTLADRAVEPQKAPARVTKRLARHPVPVMLLARLAVDRRFHGRGLNRWCRAGLRCMRAAHEM